MQFACPRAKRKYFRQVTISQYGKLKPDIKCNTLEKMHGPRPTAN